MPIDSLEHKQKLGAVNAALMVVRRLVESEPDGKEKASIVEVRARYCQLLASRLKLDAIQSHRLALAAWLSGVEGRDAIVRQLAAEHDLDDVLFAADPSGERLETEAHILGVVKCFELLVKQCPDIGSDPAKACTLLREIMPGNTETKKLIRLFGKILEDEVFLSGSGSAAGRILIVDPEESVSPVLSPPLTSDGYDVRVVSTAETAEEALKNFTPHLIMAEQAMPVVDGIEFCKAIRQMPSMAEVPFIMLTSSRGQKTQAKCLKAGADEVLTRPVDLEMLFLRVNRLLKVPADQGAAPAGEGVSGSLSDMGFSDIIQIVTAGGKSMEIVLDRDGETGVVWIQAGEIVHAQVADVEGEVAFYRLMRWTDGTFTTSQRDTFDKRTVQGTVMGLLMEGARRTDEGLLPDGSA